VHKGDSNDDDDDDDDNNNNTFRSNCETLSLSDGVYRWFKRCTRKKKSVTRNNNNNNKVETIGGGNVTILWNQQV
jgi:hypothetical protein